MEKFIDHLPLKLASGHGGPGAVAFHREKYVPMGGPSGGDGGKGGDVVLRAEQRLSSFAHLWSQKEIRARNGHAGGGKNCHGSDGENALVHVPVGTQLKDAGGGLIHDFLTDGDEFVFLKGGKGGLGNQHFATSTNQAPRYAQKGLPGEEVQVILEMKLIADLGLVGFPNAGKSTLLAAITNAKPKVAAYPFTTLTPGLGIYRLDEMKSLVVADIPGLIEGASEGRGLGYEFLRHIERTRFLFFLIECTSERPEEDFRILRNEIEKHSETLAAKPFAIGISKTDLIAEDEYEARCAAIREAFDPSRREKLLFFSSAARKGLEELRVLAYGILGSGEDVGK